MSKKAKIIEELYRICTEQNNLTFHNDLVKSVCVEYKFGNPFDITKIDNKNKLPTLLMQNDMAIIHLGNGYHKFVKGIEKVYHNFEPIQESINWQYQKSILNQFNSSESNILSVANNQRILHHFLFGKDAEWDDVDIVQRPKTYFPHRTKTSFSYSYGNEAQLQFRNLQIEIDLTIEFQGVIGVFEGKNGMPDSFSIYQLYHPFLYYYNANQEKLNNNIKAIFGVYVVRQKTKKGDILKLWAYTFAKPYDITSIKFIKSTEYILIQA